MQMYQLSLSFHELAYNLRTFLRTPEAIQNGLSLKRRTWACTRLLRQTVWFETSRALSVTSTRLVRGLRFYAPSWPRWGCDDQNSLISHYGKIIVH
jgi:hypothetical protein